MIGSSNAIRASFFKINIQTLLPGFQQLREKRCGKARRFFLAPHKNAPCSSLHMEGCELERKQQANGNWQLAEARHAAS